ncbi:hypothetical protein ACJ73_07092 [Blastomyces percursus]|uniref:P68 RBP/TagC-like beta-propeller domain-containing protein n=1 Tax=Blastomyces percursus TaxID=1658174 RepID=A0A1J9PYZ1_9EURO|nr:hypothetical protein ACJ73_07092 [Blastomyces percursus]
MHLFNRGLRTALLALYSTLTVTLAAIPNTKRFEFTKPSHDLFRGKSLHVQQSFAFDNISRRLFVAQLRDGTGHARRRDVPVDRVEANGNRYGKRLARFKWKARQHGGKRIAAFDLDAAHRGDFANPLVDLPQPALDKLKSRVFQGYAAHGSYLYIMTGTSYEASGGDVNSQVASIDMNTGRIMQGPTLTKAGSSLPFREPEGMAVYKTEAGEVRLFLGSATGKSGDRRSSLFYKNAPV